MKKALFVLACVACLFAVNFAGAQSVGAPHLFSLQGVAKNKATGLPEQGANVEVRIYEIQLMGTGCGVQYYNESFPGATDANGRFSVLVGAVTPLRLKVNTNYNLGVFVNGEQVNLGGKGGCVKFESFAGPGANDVLEGPLSISSGSGAALKAYSSCPLTAFFNNSLKTRTLWADYGFVRDLYTTQYSLPAGRVFTGFLGNPNPVLTGVQAIAGPVTFTNSSPVRVNFDPNSFYQPLCSEVATFDYYVTVTPSGTANRYVRVSAKASNYFEVTDAGSGTRTDYFILLGGWKCAKLVPPIPELVDCV